MHINTNDIYINIRMKMSVTCYYAISYYNINEFLEYRSEKLYNNSSPNAIKDIICDYFVVRTRSLYNNNQSKNIQSVYII